MLGKVFKYEMRNCARSLGPLFGMAVALAAVLRLMLIVSPYIWEPAGNLLEGLAASLGTLVLVAVVVLAFVFVVMRFFKSMVGSESYLTNTLPVKTSVHLGARLLVHSIWCVLGIFAAILCGLIFIPGFAEALFGASYTGYANGSQIITIHLYSLPPGILWSIIGLIVVFVLMVVVTTLVRFYASIAIGTRLTGNKVGGSFLGYLILNYAQMIAMIPLILLPVVAIVGQSNRDFVSFFDKFVVIGDPVATLGNTMGLMWLFAGIFSAVNLVFAGICWWLTWHFMGKKLNLD